MAGKVPNSRKPRITIKPRELPSGITTAASSRPSVPGGQTLKLPKDFELILQRCREMTAKYAGRYECITDVGVLQSYVDMAIRNGRMSIDTETTGLDVFQDYVVGFSLKTAGLKAGYVPLKHLSRMTGKVADGQLSVEVCAKILNQLPTSINLKMANAQFDIFMLKNSVGVNYTNHEVDDVLLMGRILDTERKAGKRSLKDFHADLCEGTTRGPKFSELFKPGTFHMCPFTLGYTYAARDAEMTDEVADVLEALLAKEPPLQYVYQSIEKPLLPVLIKMRERGVMVDQSKRTELTKKYRQMLGDAIASFEAAYAPFIPAINQYMRSAAFAKPKGRIELPVKIGSDDQLKVLLWDIMKLPVSEGRKVDKGVLYGLNNDIANAILEYRRCTKLLSTYLEGIEKFIQKDGCVHGGIRQIGADTGRTSSCIAEGTLVDCPGERKPIEQIRVGDEVYTYDDAGNLCVRKVTGVMDNGYRQCMTLKWQSSGTQECGSLTCTPDHMIKTKDAGWVIADHLKPRQKVFHLRARETETERVLSGTNSLYCAEHHWLKFNYFMCEDSSLHIHHEDGNHKNNRLANLIILDGHDHLSLHGNLNKDKECCRGIGKYLGKMTDAQKAKYRATRRQHDANYFNEHGYAYQGLPYTREAWLDMMDKVDWLPNKIPHDFWSVLKNLRMHRINYIDEYQKRAAEKHMRYKSLRLQPVHINYALELADGDAVVAAGFFGVSLDKFTAACEKYNISYNHMILSASDAGICHVYDLEVEDTHCYIAGEICVHNCDPNMQNIPSRNRDIRQIYRARPGCVLISCDYSGQEPRLTASLCKDPAMVQAYKEDRDLYAMIAAVAFDTTYEECLEHRPDGSTNKEGKERRSQAKAIVLGICYGRQIPSIADQLNCTIDKAQAIYDKVTLSFPGLLKAQTDASEQAHQFGYVSTIWGRRRHLTAMMHDDYEFEYAAGCNPDFDPFNPTADALSTSVAPELSRQYLKTLQGMRWWREKNTFIETLRSEHGIITKDYSRIRADMSRKALNAQIQGSAADMSKLAMINIDKNIRLEELGCQLLLMVHDEVICECPKENVKECVEIISREMEQVAAHLPVPFKADAEVSEVWYGKEINYDDDDDDAVE